MSRCWTCRRRRLKCDGGLPHCQKCVDRGVECLGYQKPLTWVSGVHTRGPLKNRGPGGHTVSDAAAPRESSLTPCDATTSSLASSPASSDFSFGTWSSTDASSPVISSINGLDYASSRQVALHGAVSPPSLHLTLTEPIFQDFSYTSRFLINYFSHRICPIIVLKDGSLNLYRDLIPLVGSSPAMASAIMALSSCHLAHSLTGSPIMGLIRGRPVRFPDEYPEEPVAHGGALQLSGTGVSHLSRYDLMQHYIKYKQVSLRLLAEALADPMASMETSTLATVAIMMIGDMVESGAGSWEIHLNGARGLLEAGAKVSVSSTSRGLGTLFDEMALFEAVGLSLARPGLRKELTGTQRRTLDWTAIGCPTKLLDIMRFLASQRLSLPGDGIDIDTMDEALAEVVSFDVWAWASSVISENESVSHMAVEDLHQLGLIFKLAIEIYGSRIASTIKNDPDLPQPSVERLIAMYSFFDREDDDLYKCLIWPTFIAGAASTTSAQREWAQRTYDKIWRITLSANCRSAAHVLGILWKRQDEMRKNAQDMAMMSDWGALFGEQSEAQPLREDWDWISELLSLEDSWLFV